MVKVDLHLLQIVLYVYTLITITQAGTQDGMIYLDFQIAFDKVPHVSPFQNNFLMEQVNIVVCGLIKNLTELKRVILKRGVSIHNQ